MSDRNVIQIVYNQLKSLPNNQLFALNFLNVHPFNKESVVSIYNVDKPVNIYAVKNGDKIKVYKYNEQFIVPLDNITLFEENIDKLYNAINPQGSKLKPFLDKLENDMSTGEIQVSVDEYIEYAKEMMQYGYVDAEDVELDRQELLIHYGITSIYEVVLTICDVCAVDIIEKLFIPVIGFSYVTVVYSHDYDSLTIKVNRTDHVMNFKENRPLTRRLKWTI